MTLPLINLMKQNALDEVADGECTEGQGGCRKRPINDGQHRRMAYLVSIWLLTSWFHESPIVNSKFSQFFYK